MSNDKFCEKQNHRKYKVFYGNVNLRRVISVSKKKIIILFLMKRLFLILKKKSNKIFYS